MPRYAPNKSPAEVKRRYFTLIRRGYAGAEAARRVSVSMSCGSLWFIDAGSVKFVETPISSRYLSQDDRIEIADGLDSLFFRLRQQLLSQLPLIQFSSHGIECFGHRQSFPPSSRPACQTKIRSTVVQTVPTVAITVTDSFRRGRCGLINSRDS